MPTLSERFHTKFILNEDSSCWLWIGNLDRDGYGQLSEGKYKKHKAHRFSYSLHKGDIPKGLGVLHSCDKPACVNPDHLFLGTQQDNMKDRQRKGRTLIGEQAGSSKLTQEKVKMILVDTRPQMQIAKDYGISQTQVSRIKTGKQWVAAKQLDR